METNRSLRPPLMTDPTLAAPPPALEAAVLAVLRRRLAEVRQGVV
jgi:hypothetical protein